jgi:hypothetical protein
VTAKTEPFYWFAINTQREMLFNKDRVITNQKSIQVAAQTIYQLYEHQNELQQVHLDNKRYVDAEYWSQFEKVMRNDLCPDITYFKNLSSTTCDQFISGSLNQVICLY